jgi:hypothetical protein
VGARFVYILSSNSDPDRHSIEFPDESHAARFEWYQKTGSGRAFAKRHF